MTASGQSSALYGSCAYRPTGASYSRISHWAEIPVSEEFVRIPTPIALGVN